MIIVKKNKKFGLFLGIFVFALSDVLMLVLSDFGLNFIFLLIMNIFIIFAYIDGIMKIHGMTSAIKWATDKIEHRLLEESFTSFLSPTSKEKLFEHEFLDECFMSYKKEYSRLTARESGVHCDISDYINEDIVEENAAKGFLTQMPGIMTGLGILGTFIGLTLGLKDFDSSNAETMAASIPPLMDGIKLAFYTSIFGVVFSILFNIVHNTEIKNAEKTVDEFLTVFYENVVPNPSNDIANDLLYYQQEGVQTLKSFAETLSIKIADCFREVAVPVFNQINDTMVSVSTQMVNKQNEGIGEAANKFVEALNSSVNNQFEHLSQTIEDTCKWQKEMMVDMQGVLDEIRASADNVTKVNESLETILKTTEEYVVKLNSFLIGVNNAYDSVNEQRKVFSDSAESQRKSIDEIKSIGTELVTNLANVQSSFSGITNQVIANLSASEEASSRINTYMKQSADALLSASGAFNNDVQASISKTFELFDSNLSDISLRLSGTISEINDMIDSIPKTMYGYTDELKAEFQKYIANVTESQKSIEMLLKDVAAKDNR